jgi:hypothetical protein
MASKKNPVRYYLPPIIPPKSWEGMPDPMDWIPPEVDREDLERTLSLLDGKPYVLQSFFNRLRTHLFDANKIPHTQAGDLLARRMGWPYLASITQTSIVKDFELEGRLAMRRAHLARMEEQERAKILKKTGPGKYGEMGKEFGQHYFFTSHRHFVTLMEDLLKEHNDVYLQGIINGWPDRMQWDDYHKSFGQFWQTVLALHNRKEVDFSEPGLDSIKRLCHYLYTWCFRRYMDSDIIFRHARFLPRTYRAEHIAFRRDKDLSVVVDDDYPELPFDEDEEDGDNIGNR